MSDSVAYVRALDRKSERALLEPIPMGWDTFGVAASDLEKVLSAALSSGGDYADVYFEATVGHRVFIEENMVKVAKHAQSAGAGVRVLSGEKTGYAYTEDLSPAQVKRAAESASHISIAGRGDGGRVHLTACPTPNLFPALVPPSDDSLEIAVAVAKAANKAARDYDERVREVSVGLSDELKRVLVATSDGDLRYDVRPVVQLVVSVIAADGKTRQVGLDVAGARAGFEHFRTATPEDVARAAARTAVVQLDADDAPAGPMPVVVNNGWSGVLIHEAVGHGLEADFNRKGLSLYSGRMGERVASELCTIVDRGDLPGRRGSLGCDDEGFPTKENVLIENGRLVCFINDRLSASVMDVPRTGNGRRQSYAHAPIPRMTNTYMLAGHTPPEEIIAATKRGLYAERLGSGEVDITNGNFVFEVRIGRMIEDGKLTRTVRGATLTGNGPDVLTKIDMVGTDLELDPGVGVCGKDGQAVPVGVGMPTVRVREITVGGTSRRSGERG